MTTSGQTNIPVELGLTAAHAYDDIFNEIEVDVIFTGPSGDEWRVPAFWAGGADYRARFAAQEPGVYRWHSLCTNEGDTGLHGQTGEVELARYDDDNPLYRRGMLSVNPSARYLQHADGTPFFWLGDTWWMGFCTRLGWPDGFRELTRDRVEKGFTLIQIVAGLYPDMDGFDDRGRNEAGFPWERDWSSIRPEYFDMADRRIQHLVESGLVPCIVGCWGYYMEVAGKDVLKKHWRNIVARWGAYPVVWCNSGETLMPWYLHEFKGDEDRAQWHEQTRAEWMDVTRYLREIDPWHHPVTSHPGGRGSREMMADDLVDIEMLQTGHGGHASLANTVTQVTESVAQEPRMPVINGEVSYEGIGGTCWQDVQRLMFWTCMMSGAAGHTYGANGIWQMSTESEPYGPSPHGMRWGDTPWKTAARLSGSREVGIGKALLERYEWWRLEPTPDIVTPRWTPGNYIGAYAATIPGQCVIVYLADPWNSVTVKLQPGQSYRAFFVHTATGEEYPLGSPTLDEKGEWSTPPRRPIYHDLVLIVEEE